MRVGTGPSAATVRVRSTTTALPDVAEALGAPPIDPRATRDLGPLPVAPRRRHPSVAAWMLIVPVDFLAVSAPALGDHQHVRAFLAMGLICVALLHGHGRYRARLHLSTLDDLPTILGHVFVAGAIVSTVSALRHPTPAVVSFVQWAALSVVLAVVGRVSSNLIIRTARRRRVIAHSTVIVGSGRVGSELARLIEAYPQYGLLPAAVVDHLEPGHQTYLNGHRVEALADLDAVVRRTGADVLLLADPALPDGALLEPVRGPAAQRCDLLVVPRLPDFHTQAGPVDHIGAIPVMRIKSPALLGPTRVVKRLFDLVLALVALTVVTPVLAVAALAVRAGSGRGVLFRQPRMTRDGRIFEVLKFRTMRPAAEVDAAARWRGDDARITRVGRVLRRTSIDELPQLWNILRGDMTLVGPRPERPYFVEQFIAADPRYADRHRVVCGLTGLAQVSGLRGDTSITDRARYDNFYIENWSPWLDVKVLLRTISEVLFGRGR